MAIVEPQNGRYPDAYVRERIDAYKRELADSAETENMIRSLASNAGYVMGPDSKLLPDYCFARECIYLAIIENLKDRMEAARQVLG